MSTSSLPAVVKRSDRSPSLFPNSGPVVELYDGTSSRRLYAVVAGPRRLGYLVIIVFFFGLGGWAALAPLVGGAMAPGVVAPESGRKNVQHLEGGIIEAIRVKDGDTVEQGQTLVEFASIQARASHEMLREQLQALLAKIARLEAERTNTGTMTLPLQLVDNSPESERIVSTNQQILEARLQRYAMRRKILSQRVEQLLQQKAGAESQATSAAEQIGLLDEELKAKDRLLRSGHLNLPEALRVRRLKAEIEGRLGEYRAAIARVQEQISETHSEMLSLAAERSDQIASEIEKARIDLTQLLERMRASEDVLRRTVVRSPTSGTVVGLKFHTKGAVVQRGETIMEIVPDKDKLLIEAQVSPLDIDNVQAGLNVLLHLEGHTGGTLPRLPGTLVSVSADRLVETASHRPYYLAKVEVDRSELTRLAPEVVLVPGMPVDVLIVTKPRTMLTYLLQPLSDALRRSFRES